MARTTATAATYHFDGATCGICERACHEYIVLFTPLNLTERLSDETVICSDCAAAISAEWSRVGR